MISVTPEQQNEHLQQFYNNGSSCLCNEETYRKRVSKGDSPSLGYPHTENSHPLANDANGSNFWITKDSMDPIWDTHDSKLAAHELGFDEKQMKNGEYYRFDDNNPQEHNLRIATGHEPGANEYFTGKNANGEIDPELYHGKISSGLPEAVSDRTPTSELSRSDAPKTFDLPSERSEDLKKRASEIDRMPEGVDKHQAVTDYNQDCAALNNRIDKEQSYINGRVDACDKEMSEWPKGSTEYNRAADNKQWYENYNNELEQSRPKYISNDFDHDPPKTAKVAEPAKADGGVHNQDSKSNATSNERGSKPSQEDNSPSNKASSLERGQKPSSTEGEAQSKGAERGQKPTEGENKSQGNNSTPRGEKPQEAPQNASNASQTQRGTPPGSTGGEDSKAPTSSSNNPSDKISASNNSAKAADEASKVASDKASQNVAPKPNGMGM